MSEALIKLNGIEIIIKSKIFSVNFMNVVEDIKNCIENQNQFKSNRIDNEIENKIDNEINKLSDDDLIKLIQKLLLMCKKNNIEEYYIKNKIKYRSFNLSSLYSKKYGIKTEKQRNIIKDMIKKCLEFIKTDYYKNKLNNK